jgi:hypothetical protein
MHAQAELPINMTTLVIGTADSARSIHCRYNTIQYNTRIVAYSYSFKSYGTRCDVHEQSVECTASI